MATYREEDEQRLVSEQAAYWVSELADGSAAHRAAFVAWLKRSPRHVGEFLSAATAWKAFGGLSLAQDEIERIVAQAREQKDVSNVVTLEGVSQPHSRASSPARRTWFAAAAAVVLGVAGVFTLLRWALPQAETYTTSIGEQRAVRLEDGSLLQLNTHSKLKVRYSEQSRDIRLMEGEALFTVQRDTARPFRVEADGVVIQALGTQFNVNRRSRDISVAVIEGRVLLNGREELHAGEQANVALQSGTVKRGSTNVADAIAWRERRLVFEDDRLEDIVMEVNRYTPGHIRLEGEAARNKRITGTFDADDPASLVLFLKKMDDLRIEPRGESKDEGFMISGR